MRRFVTLLLLLTLVPAASAHAGAGEIGIADDRVLMPGGPLADQAVAEWSASGVDTVRIFALWSRIAPAREAGRLRLRQPGRPELSVVLPRQRDRARACGRHERDAQCHRPRTRVVELQARPAPRRLPAAAVLVRGVRRGRRPPLRGERRPLHRLERAEHLGVARPAGELHAARLHAGGAAPVPRTGPRRLPGDQGRRPGRAGRDRRALPARPAPAQRRHGDAPAAVPAPVRLPQRPLGAAHQRRLPPLQAGDRRRFRDPPLQRADARRSAPTPIRTT